MDSNGVTGCDRHKLITTVWHNIVAAKAPTSIRLQFFLYFATGSPLGETQTDARLWVTWSRDVSCSPNSGCLLFLQPWEVAQRNSSHHLRTMPSRGSPPTSQNPPWNHSLYCKILRVKNQHPLLYRLTWLVVRHTNSIRHIRHWGKSSQIWLHKILKPPVPHDGIMLRMGQDRIYYARWYDVLHWLVVQ